MNQNSKFNRWAQQIDIQNEFQKYETAIWIPIYKRFNKQVNFGKEDFFLYTFLIGNNYIENEISKYEFEQFDGYPVMDKSEIGVPADQIRYRYYRFGYNEEDKEHLIYKRDFSTRDSYCEISQEFIHFHKLYHNKKNGNYLLIKDDGNEEIIIKNEGDCWYIKSLQLKQYLAFINKSLVICISNRHYFNQKIDSPKEPTKKSQFHSVTNNSTNYRLFYYEYDYDGNQYMSDLLGKKIIKGMPIEKTGIYPFEKPPKYEKFIIGVDENRTEIENTCNPDQLANFFGKNEGSPYYLTPVYFSKDVLSKYHQSPHKYKVEDGYIKIGHYSLHADTNHPDYVVVFLGDLGNDIPFSEQKYWKSKNIFPEAGMSKTNFERSILGKFADPEAKEFIFQNLYKKLLKEWEETFGWSLLKPLTKEDKYRLDVLHIPQTEAQQDFDSLIENLTVILIDSLNSKQFNIILKEANQYTEENKELKSIYKLEKICEILGFENFDVPVNFLKDLQTLRSHGSTHRKGKKDYQKIKEAYGIEEKGFDIVFTEILERAINLIKYFLKIALNK